MVFFLPIRFSHIANLEIGNSQEPTSSALQLFSTYLFSKTAHDRRSHELYRYYYTQFVGDATDRPTIKGSANFTGIALIDTDPYIPGGNGAEWYINQNQFFRQIRNFIFDMTSMAFTNYDGDQEYNATGLHWQVAQATSLQNLDFQMSVSTATNTTTMVGIFMENGSGGFLSDLTFFGGNIGFRAGNQQYTARNLQFTSCLTAISMIWDWGFTWQNIYVYSCWVAIDCTSIGGIDSQGTGSISVLDSHFNGVPYPITLRNGGPYPNIILDNLLVENSADVVLVSGGEIIVAGSTDALYFTSWNMGRLYDSLSGDGQDHTGFLSPTPNKPASLLDSSGQYFSQSRPQYETYSSSDFVVATSNGISNDGTGDQTGAINTLLSSSVGKPVFFPAGIYQVESTVKVPVGSIIVGEGWSQVRICRCLFKSGIVTHYGIFRLWGQDHISRMLQIRRSWFSMSSTHSDLFVLLGVLTSMQSR